MTHNCLKCNSVFNYSIEIKNNYFNCYKGIDGYYLDLKDSIFKKCYYTCETCETKGDNNIHNCLKCNSIYSFEINYIENNYLNCYDSLDSNFIKNLEDSNYTAQDINEKI